MSIVQILTFTYHLCKVYDKFIHYFDVFKESNMALFPLKIKVLILPKFEFGELGAASFGEAGRFYTHYLSGGEAFDIPGAYEGSRLYVKNEIALFITGSGKVNSAVSFTALMCDRRFDFSEAYILSHGCAGGAAGYAVMGDIVVVTAAVDLDLGHTVDVRDMLSSDPETTWFHDPGFDAFSCIKLNPGLTGRVYDLIGGLTPATTESAVHFMNAALEPLNLEPRSPAVIRGTSVTSDNYWKGIHWHKNAAAAVEHYSCPDPFAVTEMEDAAIAAAAARFGVLNRLIILRGVVNIDLFVGNASPESLWADTNIFELISKDNSLESADIFEVCMDSLFEAEKRIIDKALAGEL